MKVEFCYGLKKRENNGTLLLTAPLEASHWLSQYPTEFGKRNEDTFIPKHSSGGLWRCLSTVREAAGVTRYGNLGWHWRPRRVPNQSCYGYHQISHEGDAMEIFVIAPCASGNYMRLLTFIYWSTPNSSHLWYSNFDLHAYCRRALPILIFMLFLWKICLSKQF